LDRFTVAQTLANQEKKKKELEADLYGQGHKPGFDKVGGKLKATVGHLKSEREIRRQKMLRLSKAKNFNRMRPGTINNLYTVKEDDVSRD